MPSCRRMVLYSNSYVMPEIVIENIIFKMADIVSVTSYKQQASLHLISISLGEKGHAMNITA